MKCIALPLFIAMSLSGIAQDHHFGLTYDGGVINVSVNDVKNTQGRDQIRSHFQHIAEMFADGNFNVPMLIHGPNVPGTATMKQLKDELHWKFEETPRGARLMITADNKPALDAVHEFLRFQIEDHQTGDCEAIRF